MTESEWRLCEEPQAMLAFLQEGGKLSERKARLFAVVCCRRVWNLFAERASQEVIALLERSVEGEAIEEELTTVRHQALSAARAKRGRRFSVNTAWAARWAAVYASRNDATESADAAATAVAADHSANLPWRLGNPARYPEAVSASVRATRAAEVNSQAALLRDLFGPLPFRPVAIDASWLTWGNGTVALLARAAYECRQMPAGTLEQERLAVLADGLEDAGYGDQEVLGHLRVSGKVHYRGCWVIDLVLGRS
jgi:hypothetical protein